MRALWRSNHVLLIGFLLWLPTTAEAAPACAGPTPDDPKTSLPAIVRLSGLTRDPAGAARKLDAALAQAETEMETLPLIVQRYCEGRVQAFDPVSQVPTADCDGARLIIAPDGSVAWRPENAAGRRTVAGSWCLAPRRHDQQGDLNWGARAIVALRRADQLARDTRCFAAVPGFVYRGPSIADDPYVAMEMRVWAGRADDAFTKQAGGAAAAAQQALSDAAGALVHQALAHNVATADDLATAYEATDVSLFSAAYCGAAATKLGAERGALCDAGDGRAPAFARALQQVQSELPPDWSALHAALKPASPATARDPIPGNLKAQMCETAARLATTSLVAQDKLDAAARLLTLLSQPMPEERIPFPVLSGEFPLGDNPALVELTPLQGRRRLKVKGNHHGGDTIVVFVHEMQIGGDPAHPVQIAALFQGKQLVQEDTEVAQAFAAVFKTIAGAEGISMAGGGALATCNKRDPKLTYQGCLVQAYIAANPAVAPLLASAVDPKGKRDFAKRIDELKALHDASMTSAGDTQRAFIDLLVMRIKEDGLLGNTLPAVAGTPSATLYSKVLRDDAADPGYEYEVRICHDTGDCTAKTDDSSISASAIVKVPVRHLIVGTATELSWGINLSGQPIGGYSFDPVGGPGGPQRFYALHSHDGVRDQTIFSQLVVFYPLALVKHISWQGLAIGGGPSLFGPTQSAFLKQWNLRAGFEVLPALLVTIGASAREIDVPAGRFQVGDVVAVEPSDKVPTFEQRSRWAWQLSLGLAVDLAVVGKLVGGDASSPAKLAPSSSSAKGGS